MRAKLLQLPSHTSSPPHCCCITGRTDRPVVDFGELHIKAQGPNDPHPYIRDTKIKWAAQELFGMVAGSTHEKALAKIEELEAENTRLREEALEEARESLHRALDAHDQTQVLQEA